MNTRAVIVLAIVVTAIVAVVVQFLNSGNMTTSVTSVPAATPAPAASGVPPSTPVPAVKPTTAIKHEEVEPKPAPEITDADRKIDEILRSNPDNSDAANLSTAQMLINLLPTLPPDSQAEAAQHITNLLADKDYSRVLPIVKNAAAPEQVLDVFVTDLMNRDDSVKLPVLLDIAKIPNHPHREEAATDLQIFLDGDFGNDWGKWDSALKSYLAKQKAEAAAATEPAPGK